MKANWILVGILLGSTGCKDEATCEKICNKAMECELGECNDSEEECLKECQKECEDDIIGAHTGECKESVENVYDCMFSQSCDELSSVFEGGNSEAIADACGEEFLAVYQDCGEDVFDSCEESLVCSLVSDETSCTAITGCSWDAGDNTCNVTDPTACLDAASETECDAIPGCDWD